jgi:hypothetical protein
MSSIIKNSGTVLKMYFNNLKKHPSIVSNIEIVGRNFQELITQELKQSEVSYKNKGGRG